MRWALLCAALGFAWQALTVHYNYGGNWTALYVTGSEFPVPPALAFENVYVFPNSWGYDGQMYHYVAHDPLMRHGFAAFTDSARLRYRRILLPGLAFLVAGGRQTAIDASFIGCNLLFLFLGALWLSRYLLLSGVSPALAVLLVLAPAAAISLDRLTIDLSFTAMCIGFAYYSRIDSRWGLYAVLLLACLGRETGFALIAAVGISMLVQKRVADAALYCSAAVPAGLWYLFVNGRTSGLRVPLSETIPLLGVVKTIFHPVAYPFGPLVNGVILTLDYFALAGILLACILAFSMLRKNPGGRMEIAMAIWAAGALCLPVTFFEDCCSSGRVFTPLLMFLVFIGVAPLSIARALPLILVSMRTWLQLGSEALGILRGLLHLSR